MGVMCTFPYWKFSRVFSFIISPYRFSSGLFNFEPFSLSFPFSSAGLLQCLLTAFLMATSFSSLHPWLLNLKVTLVTQEMLLMPKSKPSFLIIYLSTYGTSRSSIKYEAHPHLRVTFQAEGIQTFKPFTDPISKSSRLGSSCHRVGQSSGLGLGSSHHLVLEQISKCYYHRGFVIKTATDNSIFSLRVI